MFIEDILIIIIRNKDLMKRSNLLLAAGGLLLQAAKAENWAVVIASSCGYDNYRH